MNNKTESAETILKAHCPRCDGERNCEVHGVLYEPWTWTDGRNSADGGVDHKLLKCRGCSEVFYWRSSWDSNEWDHRWDAKEQDYVPYYPRTVSTFPTPEAKALQPDWFWGLSKIDSLLFDVLGEVYSSIEHGNLILAASGLRTAFDRVVGHHAIEDHLGFDKKVEQLKLQGYVGDTEAEILKTVVDGGSAAVHRGWKPEADQVKLLLRSIEHLVHRTVVTGSVALDLRQKIPAKSQPSKKASP